MRLADTFGEVYVVSDLHLGGATGAQIFDQTRQLAGLIEHLANQTAAAAEPLALVLNGDVVDFLAGDDALAFDPDHALGKLDRIMDQPEFRPIFEALRLFVGQPGHRLVITLGNHDVELALPPVRRRLLEYLCHAEGAADEARRGRVDLCLDGTGWTALVGGRRVLVVHGNDVDDWNVVDHATLRKTSEAMLAGSPYPRWTGNAGTKLVVDVMNQVKKRWPVVDLLKPEGLGLVAVLVALDRSQLKRLRLIGPTLVRYVGHRAGRLFGLLGPEEQAASGDAEEAALAYLIGGTAGAPPAPAPRDLLAQAEDALESGSTPMQIVELDQGAGERLGAGGLVGDILARRSPEENLREALGKWLRWDESFKQSTSDETFERLDQQVGADVDILIAGHTHLERARRRSNGAGVYFNSGTWARLIQLENEVLDDPAAFRKVYEAFTEGSLGALDALPGLVLRRPTVVAVRREGERVFGELRYVRCDGEHVRLEVVAGTTFSQSLVLA